MTAPIWLDFRRYGPTAVNKITLDINKIVRVDDADWGRTLIYYEVGDSPQSVLVDEPYQAVLDKIRPYTKEG